jgi:hypothetical protein
MFHSDKLLLYEISIVFPEGGCLALL